jgi:hypothetical protein
LGKRTFARPIAPAFSFTIATATCTGWWNQNNDANWYGHVVNDADHASHGGRIIDDQYRDYVNATYNAAMARIILPLTDAERREVFLRDFITDHSAALILHMTGQSFSSAVTVQIFERRNSLETILFEQFINSSNGGPFSIAIKPA